MTYQEFRKTYSWMLNKYPGTDRVYSDDMEKDLGTMVTRQYSKVGTQWVLKEQKAEPFTGRMYANIVDAVYFFRNLGGRETVICGYTKLAYLPTTVSSISPTNTAKTVREFTFD